MSLGKQAKTLTKGQIEATIRWLATTRYPVRNRVILLLSVRAGLRAKEIAGLTWAMITDADGQISRAIHLHDNASKGRSGRTIPMHNELRLALRDLYREVKPKPDDFVISTERSKRASPQVIVNLFARWYEILGFNGSHSGRRTFITNAARKISTVRSTRARDSVDKAHKGQIRAKFLQAMRILGGAAKTIEVTYAIEEGLFDDVGYSSGQVMQRLELSGLVQRTSKKGKEQRAFTLTRTGEYVASLIDQFIAPPNYPELRERISRRTEQKAERLRAAWHEYSMPLTFRGDFGRGGCPSSNHNNHDLRSNGGPILKPSIHQSSGQNDGRERIPSQGR